MQFDVYRSFIPECYLDTNLVEVLLNAPNSVNHQKGNTKIAVLMQNRLVNNFVVALIDDDKRKLKFLNEFEKVERLCMPGLKLYAHRTRRHYFVQISPAIERWVWEQTQKAGIKLQDYNLPDGLKDLIALKDRLQRKDKNFQNLFRAMLQKEACEEIIELKRWLTFFKEHHYNSNIEAL